MRTLPPSCPSLPARRAAALPWLLLTLPVILALTFLAVQVYSLRHRQTELSVACDSAAHGGALALADDLLLTDMPNRQEMVVARCRAAAQHSGRFNRVLGNPLELATNLENDARGELLVGTLEHPFASVFDNRLDTPPDLYRPHVNAIRVAVRRYGVAASATAFVDRDVIGFKIQGTQHLPGQQVPAIPVVPLAVLCKPCPPAQNNPACWDDPTARNTWEYRIMARHGLAGDGRDFWKLDPLTQRPEPGGDGIPEMRVTFSAESAEENGQVAAVGVTSAAEAAGQVETGITHRQLEARGGQLLLEDGPSQRPPQNVLVLPRLQPSAREFTLLAQALRASLGQPRVWLLYVEPDSGQSAEKVFVPGFVAARVMSVTVGGKEGPEGALSVVLQPTMLITATAVTLERADHEQASGRRGWGPRALHNPYVGRARLVE